jgi:hypothetical protein
VRVTAFAATGARDGDAGLSASLTRLRSERKLSRRVTVTLWGLRSVQQLLRLPPAATEALEPLARREARRDLAPLEADGEGASVAIALGPETMVGAQRRREVSLVAASNGEIRRRLQPIVDAGFVVDAVVTPALALAALARARRDVTPATAAYAAILGETICLAIVRDGLLVFAREMPWGHAGGQAAAAEPTDVRLASELKRSILFFKQTFRSAVEAVVLCGDMPDLRVLTAPLAEALAVPVQTLDSLVGIDAAAIPAPAERFRSDAAALRVAIAAASEPDPPANLLPAVIRLSRESRAQRVRVVLATAASLLLVGGWYSLSSQTARHQQVEMRAIESQLAILEPDAQRAAERRDAYTRTMAQQAALGALETQGPRLARFLEALAQHAPADVVLTSVDVRADGPYWRAEVHGLATNEEAADAQASVNAFLEALARSPFAGTPLQPPSRRIVGSRPAGVTGPAAEPLPPGTIGVAFVADLRLAR